MAFALATGRWIPELAASDLLKSTGFGTVRTAQDHPDWIIACDAMSQIGPPPGSGAEATRWRVVFDGYLANGDELAKELHLPTELGKTDPARIISGLLDNQGPEALNRLIGNFAIAAGHCDDGRVVGMRDRMGGRTLYYSGGEDTVLATRSAWALRLTRQPFKPDRDFLIGHFGLRTAPSPGRSAFSGITEVRPGERLTVTSGTIEIDRRPLDLSSDFDYRHPGDCIVRFRELLEQAVATTLPPSGPVAVMLSGGLDSGPVAAIADRQLSQENRVLQACSWQLTQYPDADESTWIRVAAEELSQPIDLFEGSNDLPFGRIDDGMISPELPAYNAFRVLVNECYRRSAQHGCRVILNGNAGDQLYPPIERLNIDRLKRGQWRRVWNHLLRTWRVGGFRSILSSPAFRHPLGKIARPWRRQSAPPDWLTASARRDWGTHTIWPPELQSRPHPDYAWQLVGSRMAFGRAHESEFPNRLGVDRRDPFHDEALLRFMLNAPHAYSNHKGWDKWLMRRATRGILPDALRRKRRTGLLHSFFQAGLRKHRPAVRQLLFEEQTDWQEFVRPDWIDNVLTRGEHPKEILVCKCVGHALWTRTWRKTET
jgi:asparagine synthase (glutamine-hydrolysing)